MQASRSEQARAAKASVDGIERDIKDRCGLDDVWCSIDSRMKREIRAAWRRIIREAMANEINNKQEDSK